MKVLYEKRGSVSWIIFNRPEKLNALDKESWDLLARHLNNAKNDLEVKMIVITGKGRAFSAGDDIHAMYELDSTDKAKDYFLALYNSIESLISINKPTVAFVNGLAYGGGCEILLLCDINIALETAKFSIPEGRLGLIPAISVAIGYKALGRKIARLILTGEEIDAYNAKEIGLIDYIAKDSDDALKIIDNFNSLISNMSINSINTIKKWISLERNMLEKAIIELAFLSQNSEAKIRMKEFINSRRSKKVTGMFE